jgi:hypothetical protein
MDPEKERRIRERAYDIWQREGRPHGRDAEHWRRAAAEIEAESQPRPEPETVGAGGAPLRSRRVAKPGRSAENATPSAQSPKRPAGR